MSVLFLLGRILFSAIFINSGLVGHLMNMKATSAYAKSTGLPMAEALVPLSGILIIAGGLMVLLGIKPKIGALLVLLFLIPTTFTMHRFWGLSDPQMQMMQMTNFMKNCALMGACLMFQYIDRWPLSIKP